MNTDYQTVATGTVTPLNNVFVENVSGAEHKACREKREKWLKKIGDSFITVDIITEFPDYESLGEGSWRHQIVERIYHAVIARTNSRLRRIDPKRYVVPEKSVRAYLSWERLHDNKSGRPIYSQRWYIQKEVVALLGYPGRLGEECFEDIILATWNAGTDEAEAWVSHQ
ncbi:hypothetical protein [Marinimicrobium agarilyticum]|uniref:hypothetical protein n=1 Tax=Marinimicrobium agarilyticum TaxID=306546 RepID=UPI000481B845|nr:hypothetical protein [Marinimicrobium agarilyticum]